MALWRPLDPPQLCLLIASLWFTLLLLMGCQAPVHAHDFLDTVEPEGLQDFYKELRALMSSAGEKKARDVMKRLNPAAFSFTRGKKNLDLEDLLDIPQRRLNPTEFYGARGRRGPPDGFLGSRGKRNYFFTEDEDNEVIKRQPPHGFVMARGKRAPPEGFSGMRGKKSGPPDGFYGPRGKKDNSPFAFYGSRGKKSPPEGFFGLRGKKAPPQGFSGARGKKSKEVVGNIDSQWIGQDTLQERLDRFLNHQDRLNDVAGKRQPNVGFHPMRG